MRECPRCECCFEDDVIVCPQDQAKTKQTLPGPRLLAARYLLEKRLGRGAMGQVYLARDQNLVTRRVAVKTIRPDILSDEGLQEGEAIARFEREARAAASIRHRSRTRCAGARPPRHRGRIPRRGVRRSRRAPATSRVRRRENELPSRDVQIIWDLDDDETGNVRHIAEHDLSQREVDDVLTNPDNPTSESESSGEPVTFGWTDTGRYIVVVWEHAFG